MKKNYWLIGLFVFVLNIAFGQVENVPVGHPVYNYLKRMQLKGVIREYNDAVLPLSRKDVAEYLAQIKKKQNDLTGLEKKILNDYENEFHYEITGSPFPMVSLFGRDSSNSESKWLFNDEEKFLYAYSDSDLTLFTDLLLTLDARRSTGDALGQANVSFLQFGGRIRGTLYNKLGYYLQGTNAQFWGNRNVLRRDKYINQSYELNVLNTNNFDNVEGYVRYDGGIISTELGRERIVWGTGYGDKMIISDNIRPFEFIRADVHYKVLSYTFMHGSLLGNRSSLTFSLPSDTAGTFTEPVVADKFIASHRLQVSFPSVCNIGFQEMAIYSNRSIDLAYLNPVTLLEATQRSREERDNIFWAFDVQTRCMKNVELQATMVFDDINFSKWGTSSWENRYAYQVGAMIVDPVVENLSLTLEYTRVEPYTFSHGRSRENNYTSLGQVISHHLGPNSDSWFIGADYWITHRFHVITRIEYQRQGNNIYDNNGELLTNVGGDALQPHRQNDPQEKDFLGGNFVQTRIANVMFMYEPFNEIFLDGWYSYQSKSSSLNGIPTYDRDFGIALRVDF